MGTIWVREFTGGLDTRRLPETSPGGVLVEASNGHINRGGEFEQRAAFVPEFSLPAGTVGLAYDRGGLVVFGSGETPAGLPEGVRYQRLQIPSGSPVVRIHSFDLYAGKLYVSAEVADGGMIHFYDGDFIRDWFDGRARASFDVVEANGGATIQVLVNGVAISQAVAWAGTATATASAIAASINALESDPEYTATVEGTKVNIRASEGGPGPNGRPVTFTTSGDFTVSPDSGLSIEGGVSPANTYQPGPFVKTIGSKMYSVSGPNTHFSGVQQPTKWTTDVAGAGFVDMSSESSGSEELTALAKYQSFVAIFAERVIQIWYVDPDPQLNKQAQVLNNTGTASPRSVTQFGDNDLFYLDESGLRSLRARDASNSAATTDIGIPVDDLVTDAIRELTEAERRRIVGLIEPRDGRFWLIIKDRIFVFSFFPGSEVSAWSTYSPGFTIDEAMTFNRRTYLRSGDTIYVYGGLGVEAVHDDTVAVARLPYLDADTPVVMKALTGVDVAATGAWGIGISFRPQTPAIFDRIAIVRETSFGSGRIWAQGRSTHFGLELRSEGVGPHRLGSVVLHYDSSE
ncbi:hypothetical protein [Aureimonas psammosilenae]|uniref:hypothetical protein n=1 Tax=Aureimonas psammosilenae TaxID=2495496 RepID=UPI001261324A|nr:hypothetical protein [Aureimonas psammosilenae]